MSEGFTPLTASLSCGESIEVAKFLLPNRRFSLFCNDSLFLECNKEETLDLAVQTIGIRHN